MRSAQQVTSVEDSEREFLVFELAGQSFAIVLQDVVEVLRAVAMHMLPNAPAIVEGIINVRGSVVPVLDIRARFGLPAKAIDIDDQLILATAGQRRVALRVDRALGLMRVRPVMLEQATNLPRNVPHVAGVALLPDGLVLLHDLRAFLAEAESAQLGAALELLARSQGASTERRA